MVGEDIDGVCAVDGSAGPKHGDMECSRVVVVADTLFPIEDAVVWQADDKHILPCRQFFQTVDKTSQAVVGISK